MSEEYRHAEYREWVHDTGFATAAPAAPEFDSSFTVAYLGAIPSSHDIIRITRDLVKNREGNKFAAADAMEGGQGATLPVNEIIGWLRAEVEKNGKSAA